VVPDGGNSIFHHLGHFYYLGVNLHQPQISLSGKIDNMLAVLVFYCQRHLLLIQQLISKSPGFNLQNTDVIPIDSNDATFPRPTTSTFRMLDT
jgi:hypothetical protein